MGQMIEQVRRIAPQDTTILLGGETGTGKTRLAGVIHRLSPRRDRPFLTINCGALSANLIESEMFGHVKGPSPAPTPTAPASSPRSAAAPCSSTRSTRCRRRSRPSCLRAVEERVFEPVGSNKTQPLQARLIVASNRPLDQEVAAGRFRADLYLPAQRGRLRPAAACASESGRSPTWPDASSPSSPAAAGRPALEHRPRGACVPWSALLAGQHPRAAQRHRAGRGALRSARSSSRRPARRASAIPARPVAPKLRAASLHPQSDPGRSPRTQAERARITEALERNRQQPPPRRRRARHQPHDPLQEAPQAWSHGVVTG